MILAWPVFLSCFPRLNFSWQVLCICRILPPLSAFPKFHLFSARSIVSVSYHLALAGLQVMFPPKETAVLLIQTSNMVLGVLQLGCAQSLNMLIKHIQTSCYLQHQLHLSSSNLTFIQEATPVYQIQWDMGKNRSPQSILIGAFFFPFLYIL